MLNWKNRLLPLMLLLSCIAVVGLSYSNVFADDHDEDEDHEHDEEHWEEEEEWEMEHAMFEIEMMSMHLEMYGGLIEIVNGMTEVTTDPTATALMALVNAEDLAEEPEELAGFLEGELGAVEDKAVRRAIRLQLIETYTETDNRGKAREHLSVLIRGSN